jgi:mRNA interferase YafQ
MPKYFPDYTTQFRRDRRALKKRGYDMSLLEKTVDLLLEGGEMPLEYRDHPLKGNWKSFRECHVKGDWLLVYKKFDKMLVLVLTATGTHADLELE